MFYLEKFNDAIKNYDKSLEFDPEFIDALYNKATLLAKEFGKYSESVNTLEK